MFSCNSSPERAETTYEQHLMQDKVQVILQTHYFAASVVHQVRGLTGDCCVNCYPWCLPQVNW